MFKNLKLRSKLLLSIISVILISYIAVISVVSMKAVSMAQDLSYKNAQEVAKVHSNEIKSEFNGARAIAKSLKGTMEAEISYGNVDRNRISAILKHNLEINPLITAFCTTFEPNALDGKDAEYANKEGFDATGTFAPYWNRMSGSIAVEPLVDYTTADWYVTPKTTKKEYITEPYLYDAQSGQIILTSFIWPIMQGDNFIGIVASDIQLDSLQAMVEGDMTNGVDKINVISNAGNYVATKDKTLLGTSIPDEEAKKAIKEGQAYKNSADDYYTVYEPIAFSEETSPWSIAVSIPKSYISAQADSIRNYSIMVASIALIIILLIIYFIATKITSPIVETANIFKNISSDLTTRLKVHSKDEIGVMATHFNNFMNDIHKIVKETTNHAEDLNSGSAKLVTVVSDIAVQAKQINANTEQIAAETQQISATSEEVSSSGNDVYANIERLAEKANIGNMEAKEIEKRAEELKNSASKSIDETRSLYDQRQTQILSAIEAGSVVNEISKIADDISNIASQTNLLALNAAIEAARAGESGKGFAVVAQEVRNLAVQSSESVADIQGIVEKVQIAFKNLSEHTGEILQFIEDKVIKDYEASVKTGEQYYKDAEAFNLLTTEFLTDIKSAIRSIDEINKSIEAITDAVGNTAIGSSAIADNVSNTVISIQDVANSATKQSELAENINLMVKKFKI